MPPPDLSVGVDDADKPILNPHFALSSSRQVTRYLERLVVMGGFKPLTRRALATIGIDFEKPVTGQPSFL